MNLLTIDIEEWAESSLFLLSQKEAATAKAHLSGKDEQVERGTSLFLELLSEHHAGATFFVLGRTAQNHKGLIAKIQELGHEIASHTMTHALLNQLSAEQLKYELDHSKKLLEDMTGKSVLGFRAPSLSSWRDRSFFFSQLKASGYAYDSSMRSDQVAAAEPSRELLEIPITCASILGKSLPLGGTYFKLFGPEKVSGVIESENRMARPVNIYLHPYEIDQSRATWPQPSPSLKARVSLALRNVGKDRNLKTLRHILKNHKFVSIKDYLESSDKIPKASAP